MNRSPKTISISHLQSAVAKALEAVREKHPDLKLESPHALPALSIFYRPPLICGFPAPWPDREINSAVLEANQTFVSHLAANKDLASLAVDGKFEPAVYAAGGQIAFGFVPSAETSFVA